MLIIDYHAFYFINDFAGVSPWLDSAMVLLAVYAPVVIVVTETARALAREVVYPRSFAVARSLVWLMRLAAIGLLPPAIREAYGFPWDSHREQALRRSMRRRQASTPEMEDYDGRAPHLICALSRQKPLEQLMGGFVQAVPEHRRLIMSEPILESLHNVSKGIKRAAARMVRCCVHYFPSFI